MLLREVQGLHGTFFYSMDFSFIQYGLCAYPTRTLSCASDRAFVRSNTGGILKRASLERKKSAGAYRERSTSTNHTSLTLVFLGRFPIRPVSQLASSYGLASWTGQQLYSLAPLGFA